MATDEEMIIQTLRDWFDGWHDGDAARMDRALHPDLVKRCPRGDGWQIGNALWLPQ